MILFLISDHGMRETLNERNINVTDLVYTAINFNDGWKHNYLELNIGSNDNDDYNTNNLKHG